MPTHHATVGMAEQYGMSIEECPMTTTLSSLWGKKEGSTRKKKNKRVIITKSLRYSLVIKEKFNRKELSKTKQSYIKEYLNGNRLPRKSLLWVSS